MTFSSIVINEGNKLRKALSREAIDVLQKHGFNADGSWPEDKPFPPELQNHPLDYCLISPLAIMRDRDLPMPSPITYTEGEYSKPEDGYHPRSNSRRGARIMYSDEDRPQALKDYVAYINSNAERDPLQMIHHADVIERHADQVVNIFIDGDLVAKQSETRVKSRKNKNEEQLETCAEDSKTESKEKQAYVKHIDIRVETDDGGRYNITSTDIDDAFCQLLAVLLESKLITRFQHFFVDGEKLLKATIDQYFKYWHHRVFLDEYHIEEKIDTLTSLAIKSRRVPSPWERAVPYVRGPKKGQVRYQPMTSLSRVYASRIKTAIHYGNVDEAIAYIRHINPKDVADMRYLNDLIAYIEYRKDMIPCYALRKKAGLKNSSNSSELCNELLISERQKVDDRMHWGEEGSAALASVTAVFVNRADNLWFGKHIIKFELYYVEPTKIYRPHRKRSA